MSPRFRSKLARDLVYKQIARLEIDIADADRKIAAAERQQHNQAARRELLGNVFHQWQRYRDLVLKLFPAECPEHVPICARILDVLGARFTLSKDANGDPDIAVELTITAAAAQPWFDDSMLAMLQAYRAPDASLFFDADEQKQRPLRVVESSLWRR